MDSTIQPTGDGGNMNKCGDRLAERQDCPTSASAADAAAGPPFSRAAAVTPEPDNAAPVSLPSRRASDPASSRSVSQTSPDHLNKSRKEDKSGIRRASFDIDLIKPRWSSQTTRSNSRRLRRRSSALRTSSYSIVSLTSSGADDKRELVDEATGGGSMSIGVSILTGGTTGGAVGSGSMGATTLAPSATSQAGGHNHGSGGSGTLSIGLPSVVSVFGEEKKLALNDLALRGRDKELAVLEKCFRRTARMSSSCDTCNSGSGSAAGSCSCSDETVASSSVVTRPSGSQRQSLTQQRQRPSEGSIKRRRGSCSSLISSFDGPIPFESEVVIISGKSGTGKTALFDEFQRRIVPEVMMQLQYEQRLQEQDKEHKQEKMECTGHDSEEMKKPQEDSDDAASSRPRRSKHARRCLFASGKFNQPLLAGDGINNITTTGSGHRGTRPSFARPNPTSGTPYAAIASAFSELCSQLQNPADAESDDASTQKPREDKGHAKIVEDVREAVGGVEGLALLAKVVGPVVWTLFGKAEDSSALQNNEGRRSSSIGCGIKTRRNTVGAGSDDSGADWAMAQRRFAFIVRSFLRAICGGGDDEDDDDTETNTWRDLIILFFDDVQWADQTSLEMLKSFATDAALSGLMIVLSYREEEDEEHELLFNETVRFIEEERGEVPRLQLKGLCVDAINNILSDLFQQELKASHRPLADLLYQKTHGNAFYLLSLLREIQAKRLISYSAADLCWVWDLQRIKDDINISNNVVDMIAGRIKRLPAPVQSLLMFVACLSSTFTNGQLVNILSKDIGERNEDEDDIFSFMRCESSDEIHVIETLNPMLNEAVSEDLLESVDDGSHRRYRWPHDKIQAAAYSLLPNCPIERGRVHLLLGRRLWKIYSMAHDKKEQEWALFASVEQFGRCAPLLTDEKERVDLAGLYLDAAVAAMDESAFAASSGLLASGIELLGEGATWNTDVEERYNLRLEFEQRSAEMDLCCGRVDLCITRCHEVTSYATAFEDKLETYFTLVNAYNSQGNSEETWNLCCSLLDQLGVHLPQSAGWKLKRAVSKELARTKKSLESYSSEEDFLCLPEMTDPLKFAAMKLLSRLLVTAWHMGKSKHISLIACSMVNLTLKAGICTLTAFAFCMYGEILIYPEGDLIEGHRYGKISMLLSRRLQARECESQLYFNVFTMINHWREPISRSLDPLLQGHRIGMETGDIEHGFYSALAYMTLYYYSGLPLGPLLEDIQSFASQMAEHNQKAVFFLTLPLWQTVLNLSGTGMSDNPLLMEGEAYKAGRLFHNEQRIGQQSSWSYQMQLAVYFGDLTLAKDLCVELLKSGGSNEWHYFSCARTFFFGLIAVDLYRKKKKRKYKKLAHKMTNKLEKWTKSGAINCLHKYLILKAELASAKGSVDDVKTDHSTGDIRKLYDAAISASQRAGFGQDAALANERAGEHFLRLSLRDGSLDDSGNQFWPEIYVTRAYRLYSEWGAVAKADDLIRRRGTLIRQFNENSPKKGSYMQGRQRFSDLSYIAKEKENSAHRRLGIRLSTASSSVRSFSLSVAKNK